MSSVHLCKTTERFSVLQAKNSQDRGDYAFSKTKLHILGNDQSRHLHANISNIFLFEFIKGYLQKFQVRFKNFTLVVNKKELKVASYGLKRTN